MAIIRSKIARQLLAEGGLPRRKGFMFGSGKGSTAESMSEAAFSPDTFSGFSGDYGGFSSPAGGSGPAPDSDPTTMDDTADVNLGLDVSRKPAFTTPDPDSDTSFFKNPRKFLSINYIENELERRKNFDKTLAGKLGFSPNEKPFDDKFLSRTQELEAALNLAQRGIDVTDIIQKGRPGYNPNREGDSEPMIKLRAPITEKIEEKPKDEFADILKFYGARFARGGDVDYADQDLEEQAAIDAGEATAQMTTQERDDQGYGGGSADDLPALGPTTRTMGGGTGPLGMPTFRNLQTHFANNAKLEEAVRMGLITNEEYNVLGGYDARQTLGLGPLDTGIASAVYNVAQSLGKGRGNQPFSEIPGDVMRNVRGASTKGISPELQGKYESIVGPGAGMMTSLQPFGGPRRFEDGGEVRQEYGLGSIVKKAVGAVKKIAKSPIGKAALLGGLTFGIPGTEFKGLSGLGAFKNLSTLQKAFLLGGTALSLSPFATEEEEEKLPTVANTDPDMVRTLEFYGGPRRFAAKGGIMEQDEMLDLDGNEMDLRGGGFVPLGEYEKKDDVPARLSKNEFVFTADAVRAAGGGSVDKGADVMYKTMKTLENKVA